LGSEHRQQGLPITMTQIESSTKQMSRRMKGTEKFWEDGARVAAWELKVATDSRSTERLRGSVNH